MAIPTLSPQRDLSTVVLPSSGTMYKASNSSAYAFGVYSESTSALFDSNFVTGALQQVSYTYKKLGGDVLDIELTEENVYTAYEEAVLEYSYLVNIHQAKNTLPNALGNITGTFDNKGEMLKLGSHGIEPSTNVQLRYPKYKFEYPRRVGAATSTALGIGGDQTIYSASFDVSSSIQDYDLQDIIKHQSTTKVDALFSGSVGDRKITVKKVYYKTPHAMWRFYGYFGGMNSVGNLSTYGMYADDSTFEVIPPWQNKMQAMAYEDAIYTRNSHYSYELKNNNLRLFPNITSASPKAIWIEFTVHQESWEEEDGRRTGVQGVNNMNTLPFSNIPYKNINSIGKQWIRRFALALVKEMLGQIRGKFTTIPIPGEAVTLNHTELLAQAKEEQEKLREELKTVLDELTYAKLAELDASVGNSTNETLKNLPAGIYIG